MTCVHERGFSTTTSGGGPETAAGRTRRPWPERRAAARGGWRRGRPRASRAPLLAALWLVAACTVSRITPERDLSPAESYRTIAIGAITTDQTEWEGSVNRLRTRLVERLTALGEFERVLFVPDPDVSTSLVLSGSVIKVDKGNRALRAFVGLGAGRVTATGVFELHDRSGRSLARFENSQEYYGGLGPGGILAGPVDLVPVEKLMDKLGESTADAVTRWARGEGLER